VDDSKFIEKAGNKLLVRDALSGAVIQSFDSGSGVAYGPFYLMPLGSSQPYIAGAQGGIRLITRDFRHGKAIWLPQDPDRSYPRADGEDYRVDVDMMGEWVAWTMEMDSRGNNKAAIKRLADPLWVDPTYISYPGNFAQWTDSGNLLFCTGDGLAIVDKSGNEVRRVHIGEGTVSEEASWRRWGHR